MSQVQHQPNLTQHDMHCPRLNAQAGDIRSDQAEVAQVNELLRQKTDWEVELAVSPHDQHRFLRVYQVQADGVSSPKRALLGAIQWGIDPEHLIAAAAISGAYYRLGLTDGKRPSKPKNKPKDKLERHTRSAQ